MIYPFIIDMGNALNHAAFLFNSLAILVAFAIGTALGVNIFTWMGKHIREALDAFRT